MGVASSSTRSRTSRRTADSPPVPPPRLWLWRPPSPPRRPPPQPPPTNPRSSPAGPGPARRATTCGPRPAPTEPPGPPTGSTGPRSVPGLAVLSGPSRAAFARNIRDVLGQTPMRYVTDWRMALARDHLRTGDLGMTGIARSVGYNSPYAFAAAFRRHHGEPPGTWQRKEQLRTQTQAGRNPGHWRPDQRRMMPDRRGRRLGAAEQPHQASGTTLSAPPAHTSRPPASGPGSGIFDMGSATTDECGRRDRST